MEGGGDLSLIKNAWAQAAFAGLLFLFLFAAYLMERKERLATQADLRKMETTFSEQKDALHVKHLELLRGTIDSDNKVTLTLERLTEQQRNNANALEMLRSHLLMQGRVAG